MKNHIIITILSIMLLTGCSTLFKGKDKTVMELPKELNPPKIEKNNQKEIGTLLKNNAMLTVKASDTKARAELIEKESDDGKTKAPDIPNWDLIKNLSVQIQENAKNQINVLKTSQDALDKMIILNVEIMKVNKHVREMDAQVKELKDQKKDDIERIKQLEHQIEIVNDEATKKWSKIWMGVCGVAAVAFLIGVGLAFAGWRKFGIGLSITAIIVASIAYFLSAYPTIILIIGGTLVIGGIGVGIYMLFKYKEALVHSITTTEYIKNKNWKAAKPDVLKMQSSSSQKIIKHHKVKNVKNS